MLYLIIILLTMLATLATTITTATSIRQTTITSRMDLDAKLQRSIDLQVLAEFKEERVLHYCTDQLKRLRVDEYCNEQLTRLQEQNIQIPSSLVHRPRFSLSKKKKVRWADGWVDSDCGSTTDADE
ncbi:hypothetical protein BGX38DRAFT_614907 [Terfezia claveryi]|nr:hypothetical protein BGX38DRAFT_525223 [Terfezia claveryi]KAF8446933.1 hypothetical protein BGX38DRAFT_614907 [Terfezia claveryi]